MYPRLALFGGWTLEKGLRNNHSNRFSSWAFLPLVLHKKEAVGRHLLDQQCDHDDSKDAQEQCLRVFAENIPKLGEQKHEIHGIVLHHSHTRGIDQQQRRKAASHHQGVDGHIENGILRTPYFFPENKDKNPYGDQQKKKYSACAPSYC